MSITINASAFLTFCNHPVGAVHLATWWQVAAKSDPDFLAPLVDTGWDAVHLTSYPAGVPDGPVYWAKAKFRSSLELDGPWSVPILIGLPIPLDVVGLYFGTTETDGIYRVNGDVTDDGAAIDLTSVTNIIAPAGPSGEAIFTLLYVSITSSANGVVEITPILNGQLLTDEAITIDVDVDVLGEPQTFVHEVGLSTPLIVDDSELCRVALRGTWFQALVRARNTSISGMLVVDGLEVEHEIVRDSHPTNTYYGREQDTTATFSPGALFFGTAENANIYHADGSNADDGEDIVFQSVTNIYAPAGIGGEAVCYRAVLVLTHSNEEDVTLLFTPIRDGVALPDIELTIAASVGIPLTEVIEVALSEPVTVSAIEMARVGLRGTWFQFMLRTDGGVPAGVLVADGIEVETEVVRESRDD